MRCPNCNEKVLNDVNFCHNCGYNLKEYREKIKTNEDGYNIQNIEEKTTDDLDSEKDYKYSKRILNIFDIERKKEDSDAKKIDDIFKEEQKSKKTKSIDDIFEVINKEEKKYGNFDPDKIVEEKLDTKAKENKDDEEDIIFVTEEYENQEKKSKREESIQFTSHDEFTINKLEYDDEKEIDRLYQNVINKFKSWVERLNIKLTKFIMKLNSNIKPYRVITIFLLIIFVVFPLILYYTKETESWTFFQKTKAIVVIIAVSIMDIVQKITSYKIGIKLISLKTYQPIDKSIQKYSSILLSVIESIILSIIGIITIGGLSGFSSSVFTGTFLGAHEIAYILTLFLMVMISVSIFIDKFEINDFGKILGFNAIGIILTRLILFMIFNTFLQDLFFALAPGLM